MIIDWLAASPDFVTQIAANLSLLAESEAGFASGLASSVWLWTRVALGIGLVIFVHELGHFLAAKTFGVKCEKFYVGFDVPISIGPIKFPRTLGKFTYGETEYGIGILPLGGYVKMLGQDDDPRKAAEEAERIKLEGGEEDAPVQLDPRSYPAKAVWQRMIIISAGVIMNVITGILFAAVAFGYGVNYNPSIIGGVTPGGPAWQAGIQPGGQVISVGGLEDDEMHFREMRLAIMKAGIDDPDAPIDLGIRYDDGVRHYKLTTAPHPADPNARMIGITSPTSVKLGEEILANPGSVADAVLTDADAGARVVSYDGNVIDTEAIVPGTPLFDYLNSNPSKTVSLELERVDGSKHSIELPPQKSKSVGLRFGIGPIVSLTDEAAKSDLLKDDVITAINGDEDIDAFGLPVIFAGLNESVTLTVKRGEGSEAKTVDVLLQPSSVPQTLSPTSGLNGEIAINTYGFAYLPTKEIVAVNKTMTAPHGDDEEGSGVADALLTLQAGDVVKEVRIVLNQELPESLQHARFKPILAELEKWTFDDATKIATFLDALQFMPAGTEFLMFAERPPEGKIIESVLVVGESDRVQFERGLGLVAAESIQTADSLGSAMALGYREGKRRLGDVFQFLGMLVRGKVSRKHVGGPIKIVEIAGAEAKRGISPQLLFLTMLSMNLAILNFLPIPALDGGHMMFLIAEAIRGKRVDEELEMKLTMAGVLALLALMAFVFFNDIVG